ncbi:MAG: T9SS type A sorting domain-containing protein [Bacteroidetes bacterium]|nr:T9SS type A sorting domain-containing protein [Bacteroidota bacterium]
MKKIYTVIAAVALVLSANAQERGSMSSSSSFSPRHSTVSPKVIAVPVTGSRAVGDTLMYMPLSSTYVYNPADVAGFTIVTEDNDGLTTNNAGFAMDFGVYYSTDSSIYGMSCSTCSTPHGANFYHPWETQATAGHVGTYDSTFFWQATSWFVPAGQADNWLEFGPITIPAGGATLKWFDRFNRYRDGYEVLVSNAFSSPLSFSDYTAPAIYTLADDPYPSATWNTDTTWLLKSANVPVAYNGQQVTFAFHHNANDQDVLRLDEIFVIEAALGVSEFTNGVKLSQNMPNPTNGVSGISYELEKNASIALNIFDVTGKIVYSQNVGEQGAGVHTIKFNVENLSAGVYYYSLNVGNTVSSAMKMVVIK